MTMMRPFARVPFSLKEVAFFQDLDATVLARVGEFVYHREYGTRQIVFFPDDPCDFVYWVRKGRVRITRVSDDGRELSFRHAAPGDMFGEECLVNRGRRENYAEALRAGVLCLMRAVDFRKCVREEGAFACQVAHYLCERGLETEQTLSEMVFCSVRRRLASGLLRLLRREGGQPGATLQVTHQELANLIGSTRETTTATLHGLRTEGIVALANRSIVIRDPAALEHVARSG
ncbi:MAG TPA: Crp/Fnr family transcriptional regulator [Candidatus Hydrogenedentes bacterium]|nr:Crp/Fnr family transcriptional regulator [Candidatus Hydrogenedentota bacterium]HNT89481.1 Crp/Fnr family transcriptional regulator [Candidatus Hydrogenedentota bacterium]